MKCIYGLGIILAAAALAPAQTLTLTGATAYQVSLTWTASTSCTSAAPCTYTPYRVAGSCPATLVGSTGWTQLPATASQASAATDATGSAGTTYSYVVKAAFVSSGTGLSDPSNCITVAVPLVPSAPTGVTGSVN